MIRLLIFLILVPLVARANDGDFVYEDAQLKSAPRELSLSWDQHFLKKNYYPLEREGEGLPSIGLNQLFLSTDNQSFISIKWDVSGNFPLEKWLSVEDGHLYHFEHMQKKIAIFFYGISQIAASQLFSDLRKILPTDHTSFLDSIIPTANASNCDPQLDNSSIERSEAAKAISSAGASSVSSMLSKCFKGMRDTSTETIQGWGSSMRGVSKWVGGELQGWWKNPKKKASEYYDGVKKAVIGIKNFIFMIGEALVNPSKGIKLLREKLGEAGEWLGEILASLNALSLEQKVEMTCSLIAGIGTNLILGVLTGTAVASSIFTLARIAKALKGLGKVFEIAQKLGKNGLTKLGLTANSRTKIIRGIKSGRIKESDLKILDKTAVMNSPVAREMAIKGITCAI